MGAFLLSFDLGTSSERAVLFDRRLNVAGIEQSEFPQHYPLPGHVEQNPEDIWETQLRITRKLLRERNLPAKDIAGIGISNQRETAIVWDRRSGKPVYPAIVWQDKRTSGLCEKLKADGLSGNIKSKTGLVIDAYFSATKIHWILENVPGARERAEGGELCFGTVDSWILWKLTGGKLHITDFSNASRTMLYNIHELKWDRELLEIFNIPASMLPEVRPSSECYGETLPEWFGGAIPVCGIAGDQQAALFGQDCLDAGTAKNTYGTGCFVLMNTGREAKISRHGLLTTIAWGIGGTVTYALEGSVFVAGAAVRWLRDNLHIIKTAADSEAAAASLKDNGGVYFVPAFSGLGAPYWDMDARGTLSGLTQGSTAKHIVRAALESIAYQCRDVLDAMERDSGVGLTALNADGGATENDFLMQFQADLLNCPVRRTSVRESTALGAARIAGLACGFRTSRDTGTGSGKFTCFHPKMGEAERERLYAGWLRAVKRARSS